MGHIFISYSHKDTDYAHGLANNLQGMGFEIWIDERLDYGSQWPSEIQKQLDTCDSFILIMSPRSFASEWVQNELQRAKRRLKPIFPLLLDGDEPWLSIESTQYFDVRGGRFPDDKFYLALKRAGAIHTSSQTSQFSKKPLKTEFVATPSAPKKKKGIAIAIIVAGMAVFVVCAGVFVVLRSGGLFSPSTVPGLKPASATIALPSSTTQQPPLLPPQTLSSTKTSVPALPSRATSTFTQVPPTPMPNMVLYSWWSESRGDNWITSNPRWTGSEAPGPDYYVVRVEGYIFSPDAPQPSGTIPLYSWWSESRGDNWATTNPRWTGSEPPGPDYYFVRVEGYVRQP